jgi:hypothetical protein
MRLRLIWTNPALPPRLVPLPLLPEHRDRPLPWWAVYPWERRLSPKLRRGGAVSS